MKKVFNSIGQVFQQIKKDPMMLAACFTPFLVGALIKFGIPLIEKASKFSLQPYYPMFDLFLSIMAPVLLCFAFAMITLEEIDDKVSRYFSITPLGKSGYIFSRLGIPAILSTVVTFIGKTVRHHGFRLVRFRGGPGYYGSPDDHYPFR